MTNGYVLQKCKFAMYKPVTTDFYLYFCNTVCTFYVNFPSSFQFVLQKKRSYLKLHPVASNSKMLFPEIDKEWILKNVNSVRREGQE